MLGGPLSVYFPFLSLNLGVLPSGRSRVWHVRRQGRAWTRPIWFPSKKCKSAPCDVNKIRVSTASSKATWLQGLYNRIYSESRNTQLV